MSACMLCVVCPLWGQKVYRLNCKTKKTLFWKFLGNFWDLNFFFLGGGFLANQVTGDMRHVKNVL